MCPQHRLGCLLHFLAFCLAIGINAEGAGEEPLFSFVQVADTHIIAGKSVDNIAKGIKEINSLRPHPKFVVVTGDLIDGAKSEESFRLYKTLFSQLQYPFYSVYGNHDGDKGYYVKTVEKLNYSFDVPPYHFIVLDNIDWNAPRGTYNGGFTEETVSWLSEHLQSVVWDRKTPIIMFMHASIYRGFSYSNDLPGDTWNYEPVIKMIEPYNVIACFSGHAHCNAYIREHEIDFITTGCLSNERGNSNCPVGYRIVKVYKDRVETVYKPVTIKKEPTTELKFCTFFLAQCRQT